MMLYIGVDPGLTGAIAVLRDNGEDIGVTDMPLQLDSSNKNSVDCQQLTAFLRKLRDTNDGQIVCTVEAVSARPGQGVVSMFTFGKGYGMVLGVLAALDIPVQMVTPQKWKKYYGLLKSEKAASLSKARALWPTAPLNLVKHSGRAEALMIADYGRRLRGSLTP